MNDTKVRPLFRVMALLVALASSLGVLLSLVALLSGGYLELSNWLEFIASFAFSSWALLIAVKGKAPSFLTKLI
jgi:hypothetical protein